MPNIDINQNDVLNYSSLIQNRASTVQAKSLQQMDNQSTIAGNAACQEAFTNSQQMLAQFIETVQTESNKIKRLGSAFSDVDNELANMVSRLSK